MTDQRHNKNGPGLSRRQFLKGSGMTAAATALTGAPLEALAKPDVKAAEPAGMGPGAVACELRVNDKPVKITIEPRVTLLDALRNYADITGPKRVCDRGTCGACTILVDGKSIYACTCFALEAQGKKIETSENLDAAGTLHKVPAAFVQYDGQQCGFCTPGFVMAMKSAFDKTAHPTPAQVEDALAGNICRCGTYQQIRDGLRSLCKAAAPEKKEG